MAAIYSGTRVRQCVLLLWLVSVFSVVPESAPQGEREFATVELDNVAPRPDYQTQGRGDNKLPDPCTTPIDAISIIRLDLFIFIGKWMWCLDSNNVLKDPVRIHEFWYGLPEDVPKVDAVLGRLGDSRVVLFSGDRYWTYNANHIQSGFPAEGRPVTDFGIPRDVKHIDSAFTWGFNNMTYLVSGDMYWKMDENGTFDDYPRDMSIWRGVPIPVDAAFQYKDGKTYFFKGRSYWKFYDRRMRVDDTYPRAIATDWLKCSDVHIEQGKDDPQPPSSAAAAPQHHHGVWLCVFFMLCSFLSKPLLEGSIHKHFYKKLSMIVKPERDMQGLVIVQRKLTLEES